MIRLGISVEGQTEEEFSRGILAAYLRPKGIEPEPVLLGRARGNSHGGGNVNVGRLASEMAYLYLDPDRSFDAVTSLVDFYGFRDKGHRTVEDLEAYVGKEIARQIRADWNEHRLLPYVQVHEFEGLLFSDVGAFACLPEAPPDSIDALRSIRRQFSTPEDINDNRDTAPSRRIEGEIPSYRKRLHGPLLAEEMGLETMRAECPRFNEWVTRLESLPDRI